MPGLDRVKARGVLTAALPADPKWGLWIEGVLDQLEDCVQPVDGVVLSGDEAAVTRIALRYGQQHLFGIQQETAAQLRNHLEALS